MYVYFYRGKKAYKNQYNRGFSIQVNELGFRHFNLLMRANSLGGGVRGESGKLLNRKPFG